MTAHRNDHAVINVRWLRMLIAIALSAAATTTGRAQQSSCGPGTPPDCVADMVYGQLNSFATAVLNKPSPPSLPTSENLWVPGGVATDRAGNLYIADTGNNRVRKINLQK